MVEQWRGFAVPVRDSITVRLRRVEQGDHAMLRIKEMFPERGVCVQAGANWGYWPLRLSALFDTVYTFEPDQVCFACLTFNTAGNTNVFRYQAALGCERKLVNLWRDKDTTGNQRVEGTGPIPTLTIDDLGLDRCDLIYLDIEGEELNALKGAARTIERCRPVIVYEERQAFSHNDGIPAMLPGYRKSGAIGADQILSPQGKV